MSNSKYIDRKLSEDEKMSCFDQFFSHSQDEDQSTKYAFFESILSVIESAKSLHDITTNRIIEKHTQIQWILTNKYKTKKQQGCDSPIEVIIMTFSKQMFCNEYVAFDNLLKCQKDDLLHKVMNDAGKQLFREIFMDTGQILFNYVEEENALVINPKMFGFIRGNIEKIRKKNKLRWIEELQRVYIIKSFDYIKSQIDQAISMVKESTEIDTLSVNTKAGQIEKHHIWINEDMVSESPHEDNIGEISADTSRYKEDDTNTDGAKPEFASRLIDAFNEHYGHKVRFVNVYNDLGTLGISKNVLLTLIKNQSVYYRLDSEKYLLLSWIIEKLEHEMKSFNTLSKTKVERIIEEIGKTSVVRRKIFNETFFKDSSVLTMAHFTKLKEICLSETIKNHSETSVAAAISEDAENSSVMKMDPYDLDNHETDTEVEERDPNSYTQIMCNENDIIGKNELNKNFNVMLKKFNVFMENREHVRFDKLLTNGNTIDIRELCSITRPFYPQPLIMLPNWNIFIRVSPYKLSCGTDSYRNFDATLEKVAQDFKPREWDCFQMHAVRGNTTLEELGKKYDITRERIRQIVAKVERKLRAKRKQFEVFHNLLLELFSFVDVVPIESLDEYETVLPRKTSELTDALKIINLIFNDNITLLDGRLYRLSPENLLGHLTVSDQSSFKGIAIKKATLLRKSNGLGYHFPEVNGLISLLSQYKYVLVDKECEYVYIKDSKPTNVDLIKWILYNLGKPAHHSVILEQYIKITGEDNYLARNILATLDRSEDAGIIRTFSGTYGLIDLGATKHIAAEDVAEEILRTNGRPMHYSEIIGMAKELTDAKESTIYAFLGTSEKFISNNDGIYALIEWKSSLDVTYQQKREIDRLLINHGYNVYSRYALEYQIGDSMFKYGTLRFPSNMPLEVEPVVKIIDCNNEEYSLKYDVKYNYINRIDTVLNLKGIRLGERIWIELFSADTVRLFNEEEYKSYLKGEIVFDESKSNTNVESDHVDDILNIFFKEE